MTVRMLRFLSPALCLLMPVVCAADVAPAVLEAEQQRIETIERVKGSVVAIFSGDGTGGGSGVVITPDGFALTNFHVAKPCGTAMKCGLPNGEVYDAVIVGLDPTGDLALIKLFAEDEKTDDDEETAETNPPLEKGGFPCAEMGDSDLVRAGDWAFVMGNPFLLASDFQPTVTYGIISGVHRYQYPAGTLLEYADCIQTDASINPGNSGGPLFDAGGRLIGINGRGSFEKRGRVNVGVGYAISINQIKNFLGYLHSGRIVDHATLGARVGFDDEGRVVVVDILEDSDAYRRGLRYDDEIVSFGGRTITTPNGFKNVLGIYPKGWQVPLSFRREGRRYDVTVRLAGLHSESELLEKTLGHSENVPMPIPEHDGKPGDGKRNGGDTPIPMPGGRHSPKMPGKAIALPPVVAKHFEARRGYANYYFNRLLRNRIWDAWTAASMPDSPDGEWTIAGSLEGGGQFRCRLTAAGASLDLPAGSFEWRPNDEASMLASPPGSGGLLPAVYFWRRLAAKGPDGFGEVYYLGTAPLADHDGLTDVLVGIEAGAESRFFFASDDGRLLAIEMYSADNADPCEISFSDYRPTDGRLLPGRMEVRFGNDIYGKFKIERFQFQTKPTP